MPTTLIESEALLRDFNEDVKQEADRIISIEFPTKLKTLQLLLRNMDTVLLNVKSLVVHPVQVDSSKTGALEDMQQLDAKEQEEDSEFNLKHRIDPKVTPRKRRRVSREAAGALNDDDEQDAAEALAATPVPHPIVPKPRSGLRLPKEGDANIKFFDRAECNAKIRDLMNVVKNELRDMVNFSSGVRSWIQSHMPALQGEDFEGSEVLNLHKDLIKGFTEAEAAAFASLESHHKYHEKRADLIAKCLEFPNIADYVESVHAVDELQALHLRTSVKDCLQSYSTFYGLIMSNLKILTENPVPAHRAQSFIVYISVTQRESMALLRQLNKGFVKRNGAALEVNDDPGNPTAQPRPFRFMSLNTPNLHINEDISPMGPPNAFEQADALRTLAQIGGRATRTYVLGMLPPAWQSMSDVPLRHVGNVDPRTFNQTGAQTPPGNWTLIPETADQKVPLSINEDLFVALDRAIALANHFGIRLIIPFIDEWHWWGGVTDFAGYYGKSHRDFFTDSEVRTGFLSLVKYVVSRRNTITGVVYGRDPTILAWETGNELGGYGAAVVSTSWTLSVADTIKQLAPNHLIADGSFQVNGWNTEVLADSRIDLHSAHYYQWAFEPSKVIAPASFLLPLILPGLGFAIFLILLIVSVVQLLDYIGKSYATRTAEDFAVVTERFGKPFFVGEYGLDRAEGLLGVMDLVKSGKTLADSVALDVHSEGEPYWSYHFPGFPSETQGSSTLLPTSKSTSSGFPADELRVFPALTAAATAMYQEDAPIPQNPFFRQPPSPAPEVLSVLYTPTARNNTSWFSGMTGSAGNVTVEGRPRVAWLTIRGSTGAAQYAIEAGTSANGSFSLVVGGIYDNVRYGEGVLRLDRDGVGQVVAGGEELVVAGKKREFREAWIRVKGSGPFGESAASDPVFLRWEVWKDVGGNVKRRDCCM
ncbi:hypothetical protein HDU96_006956 [Phlyctochytrium bullatum]|nr:hypothetical protein HDU96_006956 [Phlyctochytrium bullatum]